MLEAVPAGAGWHQEVSYCLGTLCILPRRNRTPLNIEYFGEDVEVVEEPVEEVEGSGADVGYEGEFVGVVDALQYDLYTLYLEQRLEKPHQGTGIVEFV